MRDFTYRDLTTLAEFAEVVELERRIWGTGYDDVVPVSILSVSTLRGGVLVGAFDGDRMVGFVYSLPGLKHGKPLQWSHMLGVLDEFRNDGLGLRLKMLQRDRTLAMGLDLIEWTFDPLQTLNAYLNFTKLGVIVDEYEINVYGKSMSPLHGGNPTDRFVAQWRIQETAFPHSNFIGAQAAANRIDRSSEWPRCADVRLDAVSPTVLVDIPVGFTEMLAKAPELALEWRLETRRIFTTYFGRGYKAMGFAFDRAANKGTYLLVS
jgi:predicted GNAT superfamily acetyltransferase